MHGLGILGVLALPLALAASIVIVRLLRRRSRATRAQTPTY